MTYVQSAERTYRKGWISESYFVAGLFLSLSRIYSTMKQQKESKNEPIIKEKVHKLIDEPVRRKF